MRNDMMTNFCQFMQQMRGHNPNEIIQRLVSSGRISQDQLNAAQKQAEIYKTQFDSLKKNFGF